MPRFHSEPIKDLAHQLEFSPRKVQKANIARAEKLIEAVEPGKQYPYEFVCYKITSYRPRGGVSPALDGEALREDLVRLIEYVSERLRERVGEAGERVYSVEELAGRLGVSTKTLQRWRRQGLVSRRFLFPDGRMRYGFLASSAERFSKRYPDRIRAAAGFSRLTSEERRQIIREARRVALFSDCSLAETAKRIARRIGRSIETVRRAIKRYDRENPKAKIFPAAGEPLSPQIRAVILSAFRRGVTAPALARRFGRTRSSIYRIVNSQRVQTLLSQPVKYVHNPEFDREDAEERILGAEATTAQPAAAGGLAKPRPTLPVYLRSLYRTPLLSGEEEESLFRRYNYLKYKAAKLVEWLGLQYAPNASDIDRAEVLLRQASEIKNQIIQANLRLVISVAKRHMSKMDDFFELVSDGNVSLMQAVDGFDYSRGHKFSTYATWVIMRNFARTRAKAHKAGEVALAEEELPAVAPEPTRADATVREFIDRVLSRLSEREREVIVRRFGLADVHMPQTLEQVSRHFGVTKERVRQIEQRALGKLRHMLDTSALAETIP